MPGAEDAILRILNCAIDAGKRKDIKRLFADYIRDNVISIGADSPSPELEQKREVISRLLNLAPRGQQRAVLREVLQGIDAEIQSIKKGYEEDCVIR